MKENEPILTGMETDMEESYNTPDFNAANKKSKWKFLILSFFIIVAVGVGILIGYKKLNSNPFGVYKETINDAYNYISKKLNNSFKMDFNPLEDPFTLNISTSLNSDLDELKSFSNLTYEAKLAMDYKNKTGNISLGITKENNSLLSLVMAALKKDIYLKSETLFDKTIKLDNYDIFDKIVYQNDFANLDADTINIILKEYKNILINSFDQNKFTLTKTNITIANKSYNNTKKLSYLLDKENMERTVKYILENTLNNDTLLNALALATSTKVEDIKSSIEESLQNIDLTDYQDLTLNMYQAKGKIIMFTMEQKEKEVLTVTTASKFDLQLALDDATLTIKEIDDHYEIKVVQDENELICNYYHQNKNYKLELTVKDQETIKVNIEINNLTTSKESIAFDFQFALDVPNEVTLSLDGKLSFLKGKIESFDPNGSIYYKDLSESQMTTIYTNIQNLLNKFGLSNLLETA